MIKSSPILFPRWWRALDLGLVYFEFGGSNNDISGLLHGWGKAVVASVVVDGSGKAAASVTNGGGETIVGVGDSRLGASQGFLSRLSLSSTACSEELASEFF